MIPGFDRKNHSPGCRPEWPQWAGIQNTGPVAAIPPRNFVSCFLETHLKYKSSELRVGAKFKMIWEEMGEFPLRS